MRAKLAWALMAAAVAAGPGARLGPGTYDHGHLRHPPGEQRAADPLDRGVHRAPGLHLLQSRSAHPGRGHPRDGRLRGPVPHQRGLPRGGIHPRGEHGPGRRAQPGPPRGAPGQPGPLPDLLEGQGAHPHLRAPGTRGAAEATIPPRPTSPSSTPPPSPGRGRRRPSRPAGARAGPPSAAKVAKAEPKPPAAPEVAANAPRATKILGRQRRPPRTGSWRSPSRPTDACGTRTSSSAIPSRLVVDFPEVLSAAQTAAGRGQLRRGQKLARIAQFSTTPSKVARLVLDMEGKAPYRIVDRADGLQIVFGEGDGPGPAALAAMRAPEPDPAALPTRARRSCPPRRPPR